MFSWRITLIDTDYHPIRDNHGEIVNSPKPILIGDNVWIGFNCLLLKGVTISNGSIISAGSIIKKDLSQQKTIYSTDKNYISALRQNVVWSKDTF